MRTAEQAADYARGRASSGETMPDSGLCLQFTRQNYPIGSYYYSAIDAWHAAQHRHPGDRNVPIGFPTFFDSSSIYEHVSICVGVNTFQVTTFNDEIREYSLSQMEDIYGPLIGWTEDLNTVRIYSGASGEEPPDEEDQAMRIIQRNNASGTIALVGPYTYTVLGQESTEIWARFIKRDVEVLPARDFDVILSCLVQAQPATGPT